MVHFGTYIFCKLKSLQIGVEQTPGDAPVHRYHRCCARCFPEALLPPLSLLAERKHLLRVLLLANRFNLLLLLSSS